METGFSDVEQMVEYALIIIMHAADHYRRQQNVVYLPHGEIDYRNQMPSKYVPKCYMARLPV